MIDSVGSEQEQLFTRNVQEGRGSAAESFCGCSALLALTILSAYRDQPELHVTAGRLARTCTEVPVSLRQAGGGIDLLNTFPNCMPLEEF